MKKILSLLCAIAIVFSASAAPQFAMKSNVEKKAISKEKIAPTYAKPDFKQLAAQRANTNRAPKAQQEATNVEAVNMQSSYDENNQALDLGLIASDRVFAFTIKLPEGKTDLESGKTYTIDDMIADGCAGYNNSFTWFVMFTQVSLTKTVAADGAISVVADIVDEENAEWHVTYEKAAEVPVVAPTEINFSDATCSMEYYSDTQDWYLVAENDDYAVTLDIFSTNAEALPAGTYSSANGDFDLSYTKVYDFEVGSSGSKATEATATVTVNGDRTDITAVLTCANGVTYNVTMFNAPIELKDPVEVKITKVGSRDYGTDYYYVLYNATEDSVFYFDINKASSADDIEYGHTYTLDDMLTDYSYAKFNGSYMSYETAEFTKTVDDQNLVRIEATVSNNKGDVWHLVYQEEPIVPSGEEVDLFFSVPMEIPQYYTDGQWELYLSIESEEQDTLVVFVYNSTNASSPAGTFTEADLIANNSGILFGNTYIAFAEADFTVTDTDERIDLVADVLGNNAVTYHIKMFYIKPQATAQESITSNELTVNTTYYSYYGVVMFSASDENNSIALTVNVNGLGAQMAGTYVAGTDFNGEVTPAGGEKSEIFSGSIVVAVAENGNITVTGTVLCSNSVEYTLNLTWVKPEPVTTNLTMDGMASTFSESSNSIQYKLFNDDYVFFFRIYLAEGLTDVELGKNYTFADDMKSNTNSSYGYDSNYSFIDYADATFTKTFVSGADHVEVAIEDVDGNFWNLTYQGQTTAVDNVEAAQKAAKRIENGMLIIRANGKDYNAQGAVIR